ncbi:MAG: protein kinase [Polyangiaceae bacterium]|nr:protein kinase [Polyangiaceae bacterium]
MQPAAGLMVSDRVRLVRPLGAGGMGSVWVAEHLTLETEVAVKFITHALLAENPELVERFKREASAAAKIQSPHVVQTFDRGVTGDGLPYIVMELLRGESLRARLGRKHVLPPAEVAAVVRQTARALDAAHALGIVHRDVKPDNLFLCSTAGELLVKVLDFGIAKQEGALEASSVTRTGTTVGTPQYMSPEQLLSAKSVDAAADLWALAVVAYEALTGRQPFTGETLAAIAIEITSARFIRPSRMPGSTATPLIDEWFERAFDREKSRRFARALELARAFEQVVAGVAGAVAAPPAITPPGNAELATGALFPELTAGGSERAPPTDRGAPPSDGPTRAEAPAPPAAHATELRAPALALAGSTEPRAPAAPSTDPRAPAAPSTDPRAPAPSARPSGTPDAAVAPVLATPPARARASGAPLARNLVAGGAVAALAVAGVWLATRSGAADGPAATASTTAEAPAASVRATTSGPASSAPPEGPPGAFAKVRIPAGPVPGAGQWLAGYSIESDVADVGLTLHEAFQRCSGRGLAPCSDAQWQRACPLHPELGGFASWTASSTPTAGTFVVRGGGTEGCTARATATATSQSPERAAVCCERAIAVATEGDDRALAEGVSKTVLAYERAANEKSADLLRATLGARVHYNDRDWGRDALVKAGQNHFKGDPSQWTFYDTCNAVDAGRWKVDCNLAWRRSGRFTVLTQHLLFEGPEHLLVSLVEGDEPPGAAGKDDQPSPSASPLRPTAAVPPGRPQ